MIKKSITLIYLFLFFITLLFAEVTYLQFSKTDSDEDIKITKSFVKLSLTSNLERALKENTIKITQ